MGKRLTLQQFKKRCNKIHKNKYSYELIRQYKTNDFKIDILCPVHGLFKQSAASHLRGHGCQQCGKKLIGRNTKYTTQYFKKKSRKIHKNKYDYSKVDYKGSNFNVIIGCPIHGQFQQIASHHINGNDCPRCAQIEHGDKCKYTTQQYIEAAKKTHGDRYVYDVTVYKDSRSKVKVRCKIHGVFQNQAGRHLAGFGCQKCRTIQRNKNLVRYTNDIYTRAAKKVHGDTYDYSKLNYQTCTNKVQIICKKHGPFWQGTRSHLMGSGCPNCHRSYGQRRIWDYLKSHGIRFVTNKRFRDCKDKQSLPFDIFLPDFNLCIEFDGIQHFEPTRFYYKWTDEEMLQRFKLCKKRDKIKSDYCDSHNIDLLRIPYYSIDAIQGILAHVLGKHLPQLRSAR